MYEYSRSSLSSAPWQATDPSIIWNLRSALQLIANTSVTSHQKAPKKLTTEAACMIFVLLAFAILTLIGSLLDIYGFLQKVATRKKLSGELQDQVSKNEVPCPQDGKKLSETTVWKKSCKLFLSCFSIVKNGKSLLSTDSDENHIICLDGIRVLCFYMIIQAHITAFYARVLRDDEVIFVYYLNTIISPKAFLAMPILLISGILNGFTFSRQYHGSRGKISWLSIPLRTFTKFTPIEMIVVGFYTTLFSYMGSGPLWPKYATNPVCKKYWIWNLFYLSNFLSHEKQCVIQTWYLACLMQLQLFSPLLLIPIIKMPKMGYSLTAFVTVSSCLASFVLVIKYNLIESLMIMSNGICDSHTYRENVWRYFDIMHTKPHTRLSIYAIGIALGCYIYYRKLSNFKKYSLVKLSFGWITCFMFLWLCSLREMGSHRSVYEIAAFHCMKPLLYTCSVSWIIFLCVTDQCGFLNKFLSCKIFKILSRLSLPAYLLHMFVLQKYFLSFEELIDHSTMSLVSTSIYLHLWIIAVSILFSLIIGTPVLRISDLFQKTYKRKFHQKMK